MYQLHPLTAITSITYERRGILLEVYIVTIRHTNGERRPSSDMTLSVSCFVVE